MSDEQPKKLPPRIVIPRKFYILTAVVLASSLFITFFVRNPYTQAVSGDYYERRSFEESLIWAALLIVVPAIAFAAYSKWTGRASK